MCHSCSASFKVAISYWIVLGTNLHITDPSQQWRIPIGTNVAYFSLGDPQSRLGFQCVPVGIMFFLLFFCKESPVSASRFRRFLSVHSLASGGLRDTTARSNHFKRSRGIANCLWTTSNCKTSLPKSLSRLWKRKRAVAASANASNVEIESASSLQSQSLFCSNFVARMWVHLAIMT